MRIATAVSVVALVASACTSQDDDPAAADPAPSASVSASGSASDPAEPSPSEKAAAATGPVLKQSGATVNAPDGYEHIPDMASYLDSAQRGTDVINLGEDPGWRTGTLDEAAANSQKSKHFDSAPKRLADVELDGEPAYHLSGPVDEYDDFEEFGALHDDHLVSISFELDNAVPKAEREKLIASVLATFQWR